MKFKSSLDTKNKIIQNAKKSPLFQEKNKIEINEKVVEKTVIYQKDDITKTQVIQKEVKTTKEEIKTNQDESINVNVNKKPNPTINLNVDKLKSNDLKRKDKKIPKSLPPPSYVVTHFKSTMGVFSRVYKRNDMKWRVMIMCIVGLLMSFTSLLFIQNTGVYVSGTSGIFQGVARIVKVIMKKESIDNNVVTLTYQLMFYGLYLITNIPLMIFSWKKMGKRFTILSSIPVVISNVLPLILNQIPGINNFFIFGNTANPDPILQKYEVQLLNFHDTEKAGEKAVFMFLYSVFAGLINGVAYSMALAVGGSTGGLDFITFFLAYKKKKSIGPIMLIFNSGSVLLSSIIGSYIAAGIADSSFFNFYNIFSQNLLSGIVYVLAINVVIGNLFPKDKIVKIQIYCDDVIAIRNYLYSINFNHSLTINTATGGYSLQEKKNIEIICLYIEVPKILSQVKQIDKYMLITITPISGIDGRLSVEDALN